MSGNGPNAYKKSKYTKCDFPKMKYRMHSIKANPEKTKKLIEERKRRESEWKKWLTG